MTKIILLVLTVLMMVGCAEKSTQPIELHEINTYIIDSCEYVGEYVGFHDGILAHKGNCRFCTERREQELKELVEQLKGSKMKARIKKTEEIVEVTRNKYGLYVDENCVGYSLNDLDFGNEEDEHWQDVRERAAIAAMQGVMNFFGSIDYNRDTIAKLAVEQADALIAELKKK